MNQNDMRTFIDSVEKIAFEIPPPNEFTPRLVQLCVSAKSLLARPSSDNKSALQLVSENLLQALREQHAIDEAKRLNRSTAAKEGEGK